MRIGLQLIVSAAFIPSLLAVSLVGAAEWRAPGPNIAQGKSYKLLKKPNYALCADEADATQLTDGQFAPTEKPMWFFKPTVGWSGFVTPITIDLGSDQPIAGVGFNTEISPIAGVGWPPAILIFVSNDDKDFHYAGELIAQASKFGAPPDAMRRHFFRTDELQTHGRYVQLVALTSIFTFTDEIEIYQGKQEWLQAPLPAEAIANPAEYTRERQMAYAMAARLATDAARAQRLVEQLHVVPELTAKLSGELEALRSAAVKPNLGTVYDIDYRAIAPLTPEHAQMFALLSQAYRAAGYPEVAPWHNNRWNRQSPFTLPPALVDGKLPEVALDVALLQNDRRGEALNIGNFSDAAKTASVRVAGLPGGPQPSYLRIHHAEYVALQSRAWDADALPLATATGSGWNISLPAGISRQIWLDFNVDAKVCPPGTHRGSLEIEVQGGPKLTVPLTLTVAPYRLPDANEKAVAVGVWDYTDLEGCGGLIASKANPKGNGIDNLNAIVQHLRESGISAPWGRSDWRNDGTFPRPFREKKAFDDKGNFVGPLDFSAFDRWVAMWPNAKYYMIHAIAWWEYADAGKRDVADPEVQRRLGIVMKKWAEHIREKGIDPNKIVLLLVDEPIYSSQAKLTNFWAKAIKEAVPEFKIYVDPMLKPEYYDNADVQQMLDYADIITPGTEYSYHHHGQAAVDYYDKWRAKGKIMGFYSCAQNPSEGEAIRYFRLQQIACWKLSGGAAESWAGYWAYCDMRGVKPWNQLAGSALDRNWCQAYVDTKSATDGKHWLAIFEGVNDYEYLLTLKKRIAELEAAGQASDALTAAKKVLAEVPDEIIDGVRNHDDASACDAGRLKVLAALAALAPQQ